MSISDRMTKQDQSIVSTIIIRLNSLTDIDESSYLCYIHTEYRYSDSSLLCTIAVVILIAFMKSYTAFCSFLLKLIINSLNDH